MIQAKRLGRGHIARQRMRQAGRIDCTLLPTIMNSAGIPAPPPGDHEPPDGQDLARRVTVLETRFDTVLPTLATKADLAELRTELLVKIEALRAEMECIASNVYKWMAATLITILLSFIGMFVGLTKTLAPIPIPAPATATSSPHFDLSRLTTTYN